MKNVLETIEIIKNAKGKQITVVIGLQENASILDTLHVPVTKKAILTALESRLRTLLQLHQPLPNQIKITETEEEINICSQNIQPLF